MGADDEPDFGSLLRDLRGSRSQRAVSDLLRERGHDTTPQTISNWENNKNPPRDRVVIGALDDALEAGGQLLAVAGYSAEDQLRSVHARLTRLEDDVQDLRRLMTRRLGELRGPGT